MKTKCKRCGHEWLSRVEKPRQCPRCRSYRWNEDKSMQARREWVGKQDEKGEGK